MAKKVEEAPQAASGRGAASAADEISVLHPDRSFELAGRKITVREYGHIEGLRLQAWAKPFLDDLYARMTLGSAAPKAYEVQDLFATHADLICDMEALAAGVERSWVEQLNDQDGELLMAVWWQVNANFFFRRMFARAAAEKRERRSAGPTSTTPSSPPDMAAPPPTSAG